MAVRIFNNFAPLNAQRLLGINNDRLAQSVERVASGIRINRGTDDAARWHADGTHEGRKLSAKGRELLEMTPASYVGMAAQIVELLD